jgi:hypothetical protein
MKGAAESKYGLKQNDLGDQNVLRINSVPSTKFCVRFEVLTAVTVKNTIFWDVMPCNLV